MRIQLLRTTCLLTFLLLTTIAGAGQDVALTNCFQRLHAGQKLTVIAYGTSLTQYGAWVDALQQWFEKNFPGQVTVVNSGGHGQHSDWGFAQVKSQVLDHHPDLVFIEFAANDAHVRFKLSVEHCRENLDKIVRAIQTQNPQVDIVLQTMNSFWDAPTGFKAAATDRPQLESFNDNYRNYAREHHLPLVDNYPVWRKLQETDIVKFQSYLPDGTHPNKPGSLAITWPAIERLLEAARQSSGN